MIYIEEISPPKKIPGLSSLKVQFDYNKELVAIMHQLDRAIFDKKEKYWEIPVTSLSYVLDGFTHYDDVTLTWINEEDVKEDIVYKLQEYKTKPFKYQEDGIQYALNHDKFLLLDAPGLGKTLQMIYAAQELKDREDIEHCLIICGINTLKSNWKREIQKHSDLSCRILGERKKKNGRVYIGSVNDRIEDLKNPIEEFCVITNIETLRNNDIVKAINKGPNRFDMIVVDEIHTCKNSTSSQGENLLKLKKAKHKIGMTGTLLLNNPLDTYVPLKFIDAEQSNLTDFKYYYCRFGGNFGKELIGFKNMKVLKEQLDKYSLRRTKDLLDLPEKNIINQYIDMSDRQLDFYNNIKQGIIDQVDKVHISTSSLLSMITRLRQATACPSILTTENIPSCKIDRTIELVEEIVGDGNKVVIFSTFKETANRLNELLKEYNPLLCTGDVDDITISDNIERFQNLDDNKVFIATWQKVGTGVTLTAANYAIFIDTPWTDGVYQQAQDRIHRIGSKKPVFIYNLIVNETVDERVLELVNDKAAISNYVVDDQITEQGLKSLRKYIEELS